MNPEDTAARMIKALGISAPPVDVQGICERLKCVSLRLYGGKAGSFIGMSSCVRTDAGAVWTITVNSRLPLGRMRFTIAHELGHCVLNHRGALCLNDGQPEIKRSRQDEHHADRFAAELLMPDEILAPEWCWYEPEWLAKRYAVSLSAMTIRLERFVHHITI